MATQGVGGRWEGVEQGRRQNEYGGDLAEKREDLVQKGGKFGSSGGVC